MQYRLLIGATNTVGNSNPGIGHNQNVYGCFATAGIPVQFVREAVSLVACIGIEFLIPTLWSGALQFVVREQRLILNTANLTVWSPLVRVRADACSFHNLIMRDRQQDAARFISQESVVM